MEKLTVKELKAKCKELGLSGYSKLRKAELIELLNNNISRKTVNEENNVSRETLFVKINIEYAKILKELATYDIDLYNDFIKSFRYQPEINARLKRALGRCKFNPKTRIGCIEVSHKMIFENEIESVLRHEIAHAITFVRHGSHGHDSKTFKRACNILGAVSSPSMYVESIRIFEKITRSGKVVIKFGQNYIKRCNPMSYTLTSDKDDALTFVADSKKAIERIALIRKQFPSFTVNFEMVK